MFLRKISCIFRITLLFLPIFLNAEKKGGIIIPTYFKDYTTIKPKPGDYTKNVETGTMEEILEKLNNVIIPNTEEFQDLAAAYQVQKALFSVTKKEGKHLSNSSDTIINDSLEKAITNLIQGPIITAKQKDFFNTIYSFLDNVNKRIGNNLMCLGLYENLRRFFSHITKYKNIIENPIISLQEKQEKASEQIVAALMNTFPACKSFHKVIHTIHKKFDINPWLGKKAISWNTDEKEFYVYPQPGKDLHGRTPLHLAVLYGDVASVLVLIVMGANSFVLDKDDKHPLCYLNPDCGDSNLFIVEIFLACNPLLAYSTTIKNAIDNIFLKNPSPKKTEMHIKIMKIFKRYADKDT